MGILIIAVWLLGGSRFARAESREDWSCLEVAVIYAMMCMGTCGVPPCVLQYRWGSLAGLLVVLWELEVIRRSLRQRRLQLP